MFYHNTLRHLKSLCIVHKFWCALLPDWFLVLLRSPFQACLIFLNLKSVLFVWILSVVLFYSSMCYQQHKGVSPVLGWQAIFLFGKHKTIYSCLFYNLQGDVKTRMIKKILFSKTSREQHFDGKACCVGSKIEIHGRKYVWYVIEMRLPMLLNE